MRVDQAAGRGWTALESVHVCIEFRTPGTTEPQVKLYFLGANQQVTGSRYCLEASGHRVMVDCGLFQEWEYKRRNWDDCPLAPSSIESLLLTHIHIDHSGLVPRLVKQGFAGPIYCTRPTLDLAEIMLTDSAEIQVEDAQYKKRRHRRERRKGPHPELPLYTVSDVERTLPLFQSVKYFEPLTLNSAMSATFHDAGHILGSAMIEFQVHENGKARSVIFSGDIGQFDKPIIRDPTYFEHADLVVMESTYGDRDHEPGGDIESRLGTLINETVEAGGNVVIPTFAVERAQEVLYYLSRLIHDRKIPAIRVFLDSPMAADVTEIFRQHRDSYDQDSWEMILANKPPFRFPGLEFSVTGAESKRINEVEEPCVIMATSGMCTSGRIKHHLRRNIERRESTILFVGYQAHGTLGRQIQDRQTRVRIHGREYDVRARVERLDGFSGHADRGGLLRWAEAFRTPPQKIFLTHGDREAAQSLKRDLESRLGCAVQIPEYQEVVEI